MSEPVSVYLYLWSPPRSSGGSGFDGPRNRKPKASQVRGAVKITISPPASPPDSLITLNHTEHHPLYKISKRTDTLIIR